jgi:hypothetical protein
MHSVGSRYAYLCNGARACCNCSRPKQWSLAVAALALGALLLATLELVLLPDVVGLPSSRQQLEEDELMLSQMARERQSLLLAGCAPEARPSRFECPAYVAQAASGPKVRMVYSDQLPWFTRRRKDYTSAELGFEGRAGVQFVAPGEDFDVAVHFFVEDSPQEETEAAWLMSRLSERGKRLLLIIQADGDHFPAQCSGGHIIMTTHMRVSQGGGQPWFIGSGAGGYAGQLLRGGGGYTSDREPCAYFQLPYFSSHPGHVGEGGPRPVLASFSGSASWPKRSWLLGLKPFEDVQVTILSSNWWDPDYSSGDRERLRARFRDQLQQSVFGLCPRGNGYSSIRLVELIFSGALPVLMDDWIMPFGEPMCEFALRTRLEGDPADLVNRLRTLRDRADLMQMRRDNMRRFADCYFPDNDRGTSMPFILHVVRRALAGDLSRWVRSATRHVTQLGRLY